MKFVLLCSSTLSCPIVNLLPSTFYAFDERWSFSCQMLRNGDSWGCCTPTTVVEISSKFSLSKKRLRCTDINKTPNASSTGTCSHEAWASKSTSDMRLPSRSRSFLPWSVSDPLPRHLTSTLLIGATNAKILHNNVQQQASEHGSSLEPAIKTTIFGMNRMRYSPYSGTPILLGFHVRCPCGHRHLNPLLIPAILWLIFAIRHLSPISSWYRFVSLVSLLEVAWTHISLYGWFHAFCVSWCL